MNKKRCIIVAVVMSAILIGLYSMPEGNYSNSGGVVIAAEMPKSEKSYSSLKIEPKKEVSKIIPIPVVVEQEVQEEVKEKQETITLAKEIIFEKENEYESEYVPDASGEVSEPVWEGESVESPVVNEAIQEETEPQNSEGEDAGDKLEVEPDSSTDVEPIVEESQMEYLGDWTISFYCNCYECCGQWSGGATASGVMPSPWYTAATGDLPFGTILYVDGLGTFEVQDRGTGYGWLDIFVSDHSEALANGLQTRAVYIVR